MTATLRRDGRVALTMTDPENFYRHVSVRGTVVDISDDAEGVDIDRLSQRYVGMPYPRRKLPRVSVRIVIDRWHGWHRSAKEPTGGSTRERLPV